MNKTTNKFSPEVRERGVRLLDEHRADYCSELAAMTSIAGKIGSTAETLHRCWCRQEASPKGPWLAGPAAQTASDRDRDRLKLLEREVKELRRANEILRKPVLSFVEGGRSHLAATVMAERVDGGNGNPALGRLVQQPPPLWPHRIHPARRG